MDTVSYRVPSSLESTEISRKIHLNGVEESRIESSEHTLSSDMSRLVSIFDKLSQMVTILGTFFSKN